MMVIVNRERATSCPYASPTSGPTKVTTIIIIIATIIIIITITITIIIIIIVIVVVIIKIIIIMNIMKRLCLQAKSFFRTAELSRRIINDQNMFQL